MPIVITLVIAIFLILVSWTWHNLGKIEKIKKIIIIAVLLIFSYIVTFIVFDISKKGVNYKSQQEMEIVKNVIVILFTILNGLLFMPFLAKNINGLKENAIDRKVAIRKISIIMIVFIFILIIECGYLKDIQQGILNIYAMKK